MPGGGTLRIYRDKLASGKKFLQIVRTVRMVTLAKYRQTVVRVKTRDETLRFTRKIFDTHDEISEEDAVKAVQGRILYIPVTSNRGSCGSLNTNMARYLEEVANPKMDLLVIGKKGNDSYSKIFTEYFRRSIINDMKQAISFGYASYVVEHAKTFQWDRLQIIYNRYHSASTQRLASITVPRFEDWKEQTRAESAASAPTTEGRLNNHSLKGAITYLDDEEKQDLYDFNLAVAVMNATSENELSEYAARIIAVENQLANITELLAKTEYYYNKTRKEGITAELLEIIGTMTAMVSGEQRTLSKPKLLA